MKSNKKSRSSKFSALLFLIGSLIFLISGLRYAIIKNDFVGAFIYGINTILFFVASWGHYFAQEKEKNDIK